MLDRGDIPGIVALLLAGALLLVLLTKLVGWW